MDEWEPDPTQKTTDVEPDLDDDGDYSGFGADTPCIGGAVADCDDNCPHIQNLSQIDTNSDGIGDVCEGLVAYYPLNGNAMDLTPNANHGVVACHALLFQVMQ